ncbi:hypothetical protein AX14_010097 [Amanita brunnescens Koide BX004]|nr:hypothetical protein AX14_010097 [Amanita brunnescens Koide BX004]
MAAVRHHHRRSPSNPFADSPSAQHPPPPPPKSSKHSRPSSARMYSSRRDTAPDVVDAVRDTVVIRHGQDPPRTRPGRSQTASTPPSGTLSHAPQRRSHSQDSAHAARQQRSRSGKKNSKHADAIDRLDYTGVAMFHHDGPFDACAPSRNQQLNMAPIHAWSPSPEDELAYGASAYPGAHAYGAFSNDYPEQPKKKVDAIAEAWGMHEPEPFEEFQAGGGRGDTPSSSIYNGRSGKRTKDGRDAKEVYKEYLDESAARPRLTTRRTVPPPQPILVPAAVGIPDDSGTPKRSRSLMQRIRKMRDAPNVPVGSDNSYSSPSSPVEATRPTHRSQNSFLGRFSAKTSPSANAGFEKPEPFVYIDAHNNKELPATPTAFDAPVMAYSQSSGPSGSGLGRKTSLMQKVGRVVRGR